MLLSKHTDVVRSSSTVMLMVVHAGCNSFLGYFLWLCLDRNQHVSIHSSKHMVRLALFVFEYHLLEMS